MWFPGFYQGGTSKNMLEANNLIPSYKFRGNILLTNKTQEVIWTPGASNEIIPVFFIYWTPGIVEI